MARSPRSCISHPVYVQPGLGDLDSKETGLRWRGCVRCGCSANGRGWGGAMARCAAGTGMVFYACGALK